MKKLIYLSVVLLVLASCHKTCPVPDGGIVYTPDPYSDGTYDPDPDPDPAPYTDPDDPDDPDDPSDPGDPGDSGDDGGCSTKHTVHIVHAGKATSFNSGNPNGGASGR